MRFCSRAYQKSRVGVALIICGRAETVITVFALGAEVVPEGDLVEAAVVETDIPRLVGIVVREHEPLDVQADDGGEELQALLALRFFFLFPFYYLGNSI